MTSKYSFKSVNTELPSTFDDLLNGKSTTLSVPPKTDLYASPTLGFHFSIPLVYIQIPTKTFGSARVTVSVPLTEGLEDQGDNPTLQFDQAGLAFVLPHSKHPNPSKDFPGSGETDAPQPHPKWLKAGVEVHKGGNGSVVSRDRWSDWSLFRINRATPKEENGLPYLTVTYEFEREDFGLVINHIVEEEEGASEKPGVIPAGKYFVREVVSFFQDEDVDETLWVGIYGARPDPSDKAEGKELQVIFQQLEIKDKSGNDLI